MSFIDLNDDKGIQKKKKTRNRKPKPPSFFLPARGDKCIKWLPIAIEKLVERVRSLSHYRLVVIEMVINKAFLYTFRILNLSYDILSHNKFRLQHEMIINKLVNKYNTELFADWNGPKLRGSKWKTKLWEGPNGYYKLCKNWIDQNKYQVFDIFWVNVYTSISQYISNITNMMDTLSDAQNTALFSCLMCCCLHTTFTSEIGFPKTRLLPLLVNTVIAKNAILKRYLKREFDAGLSISQWKEQESEKYDGVYTKSTENKICAAVKKRCCHYTAHKTTHEFAMCYRLLYGNERMDELDFDAFVVQIKFDTNGCIIDKEKKKDINDSPNTNTNNALYDANNENEYTDTFYNEMCINNNVFPPNMNDNHNHNVNGYKAMHGPTQNVEYHRSNPMRYSKRMEIYQEKRANVMYKQQVMDLKAMLNNFRDPIHIRHHQYTQQMPSNMPRFCNPSPSISTLTPIPLSVAMQRSNYIPNHPQQIASVPFNDNKAISIVNNPTFVNFNDRYFDEYSDINGSTMPPIYNHDV